MRQATMATHAHLQPEPQHRHRRYKDTLYPRSGLLAESTFRHNTNYSGGSRP